MKSYRAVLPNVTWEYGAYGLFALFNDNRDGWAIQVNRIGLALLDPKGNAAGGGGGLGLWPGHINLERVSAATLVFGGATIVATKHDTGADALPAQVVCYTQAAVTATAVLSRQLNFLGLNPLRNQNQNLYAFSAGRVHTQNTAKHLASSDNMFWAALAPIEGIVLRAGEGVAVLNPYLTSPHALSGYVTITVREVATGHTYTFTAECPTSTLDGPARMALMNRSGSGVVLEVLEVAYQFNRQIENETAPLGMLHWLAAVRGGEMITPVAHDTAAACPSWVRMVRGPCVPTLGGAAAANDTSQYTDVFNLLERGSQAAIAPFNGNLQFYEGVYYGGPGFLGNDNWAFFYAGDKEQIVDLRDSRLRIPSQHGIGLVLGAPYVLSYNPVYNGPSALWTYDAYVEFCLIPPSHVDGQAGGYLGVPLRSF